MSDYNLLRAAWIPVIYPDGKRAELGIIEVLEHSHEILAVDDPSPVVEFGVSRFIISFVADALGIDGPEDLAGAIDRGKMDMDKVLSYIEGKESRFDIFDEKTPFYQSIDFKEGESKKSIGELFRNVLKGTEILHFSIHRVTESNHAVSPIECAKGILSIPPFASPDGGGRRAGINGSFPPLYVLVNGKNLLETIILNIPVLPIVENHGTGPVTWMDDGGVKEIEKKAVSTLEGMTLMPRSVKLLPSTGGKCDFTGKEEPVLVREILFRKGTSFSGSWKDPSVAYKTSKYGTRTVKMDKGKEIWRDTGSLSLMVELQKKKYGKNVFTVEKPIIVQQWEMMVRDGLIKKGALSINIYGIRGDGKGKTCEWITDHLSIPAAVAMDKVACQRVNDGMILAEKASTSLYKAIKSMDKSRSTPKFLGVIQGAQRTFWMAMERLFLVDFLQGIAGRDLDDVNAFDKIDDVWKKRVFRESWKSLSEALESFGNSSRILEERSRAEGIFKHSMSEKEKKRK